VKQEGFRLEVMVTTFPRKDSPAVEEAAVRGCSVSILGGFEDATGSIPEQPGLTWPDCVRLDKRAPEDSSRPNYPMIL